MLAGPKARPGKFFENFRVASGQGSVVSILVLAHLAKLAQAARSARGNGTTKGRSNEVTE